jgi:tetratricopeptide (TPR) repeat protein
MRLGPVVALALVAGACQRPSQHQEKAPPPVAVPASSPLDEARRLLKAGDPDGALGKLREAGSGADALCTQGVAWAKKAELAPLPTPPPLPNGAARGAAPPPAPEFKPEELQALEFFERALAAQAGHPQASLGLADLLAPHALRRHALEQGAAARRRARRPRGETPAEAGPDFRAERVIQAYRAAIQGDPASREPVERMIELATRVGRLDDTDQGLQELLRRDTERPEPFVRYGDFLLTARKDPLAAIEQYRQALIWRPDDTDTKAKIADIYIAQGIESYGKSQYAVAEARFLDAQKYASDPRSPQGLKIQDYMGKLRTIRQPLAK